MGRYSDFMLLNEKIASDPTATRSQCWIVEYHALICIALPAFTLGPMSQKDEDGRGRLDATLGLSLSHRTSGPPEWPLSKGKLMREERLSQPPQALLIPCSKGLTVF